MPAGETGGGVAHAIVGTLDDRRAWRALVGVPLGVGAGIYCAEYPGTRLAKATRFLADVMNGTPSIVVGRLRLDPDRRAAASTSRGSPAAAALAMLMIPMVMRTTEELIKLVPHSLREAALALGYPRWRTSLAIIVADRPSGNRDRQPARGRPGGGRDRSAPASRRSAASSSAFNINRADGGAAADGLPVRHRTLRGVAPVRLGGGAGADPGGAGPELCSRGWRPGGSSAPNG